MLIVNKIILCVCMCVCRFGNRRELLRWRWGRREGRRGRRRGSYYRITYKWDTLTTHTIDVDARKQSRALAVPMSTSLLPLSPSSPACWHLMQLNWPQFREDTALRPDTSALGTGRHSRWNRYSESVARSYSTNIACYVAFAGEGLGTRLVRVCFCMSLCTCTLYMYVQVQ